MTRWLSGVAIAMSALTPIAATATPPSDAQTVTTRPAHILTSAARHETFLDAMVRSASADRDEAPEPVDVAAAIDAATDVLDRAWELPEVAPPALRSMRWPVSSSRLVAGFGPRSRAGGTRDRHTGMSFRAADTSVVAAADGVVAEVSTVPGLGIVVVVAHGGGILSVYG
ncbi:MAG: peptidoglycan DD-metalloendopeptidase family protein, partial [Myxococcales bacterium]|nr:peptidoglycan DD-metalloendopeptidase family protein [Myxococcales bacterium]